MGGPEIDVIATSISGSIEDWGKVRRIVPLFESHGFSSVTLFEVGSHQAARMRACECVRNGRRIIISAGGSGTFNRVLEGCYDAGVDLEEVTLGFLRKGSADLIGKVLGMPDDIEEAIKVFADSINAGRTVGCDVILVESEEGDEAPRHFVGYAGAEIFGEIPHVTENRFIKYYKGVLSQLFGDLGPFFVGAGLASVKKVFGRLFRGKLGWQVLVDGAEAAEGRYQAFIIVNGDLGKDLPLAKGVPLGSGDFYLFALRDLGVFKMVGQFKRTWNASILEEPDRWGFEQFRVEESLVLRPDKPKPFSVNVDGSAMPCVKSASFRICDRIKLISR